MSTKKFLIITGLILLPAIVLLGYSQFRTVKATNTESINYAETFLTQLDGGQQVSSVETDAHGQYEIKARSDGSMFDYTLTLENIENVIGAHLHCGVPGENGPVVVPLMIDQVERDFANGSVSGSISMDDITEAGMQCQPNIDTLAHLMQAIRENKVYVNVHTTQYPDGEIRGQVVGGDMHVSDGTSALRASSTPATSTPATSADTKEKSVENTNSKNSSQKITNESSGKYAEDPNDPGCGYKDGVKYCQYLKRQRLLREQGKSSVGFPDAGGKVNTN